MPRRRPLLLAAGDFFGHLVLEHQVGGLHHVPEDGPPSGRLLLNLHEAFTCGLDDVDYVGLVLEPNVAGGLVKQGLAHEEQLVHHLGELKVDDTHLRFGVQGKGVRRLQVHRTKARYLVRDTVNPLDLLDLPSTPWVERQEARGVRFLAVGAWFRGLRRDHDGFKGHLRGRKKGVLCHSSNVGEQILPFPFSTELGGREKSTMRLQVRKRIWASMVSVGWDRQGLMSSGRFFLSSTNC